jgi:hypothetical protein
MVISPLITARLTYLFGLANVILLALILLSCRCLMGKTKFTSSPGYMKFSRHHCLLWYLLILSEVLHGIFAYLTFGIPLG